MNYLLILLSISIVSAFDGLDIGYDGSQFQSATFHKGKFIYGLDFLHANVSTEILNETEYCAQYGYDYYGNYECVDYSYQTNSEDFSISVNVFMPRFGYKMGEFTSGKISSYNQIEGFFVFPLVSINVGDGGDTDEVEEALEDIVDVFGFKLSKVVQYNFSNQLALQAHVGFNLTFGGIDDDLVESAINGRLGMTYTKLSLKFSL